MRHVRGAFILLHLIAITIAALPAPIRMAREVWKEPTLQFELGKLSNRLNQRGFDVDPERLEEFLWNASERYIHLNERLRAPFHAYYDWSGTNQRWNMFAGAHHYPCVACVDVRLSGAWAQVYEARSPRYRWNAAQFEHLSFRYIFFLYELPTFRALNDGLLERLARRAARDFPSADEIRLRYVAVPIPTPHQIRRGDVASRTDHLVYTRPMPPRP